jgi:UDP-N-acetylglucosamine--N-acetylmuramyl-(pentapeptide) pyrophosphoryl-undecaprenol N-acetylglucosamine transferase
MERDLVCREGVDFVSIQAGAMHGVGALRMVRGALKMVAGVSSALGILARYKPDVVLLTGGFVGVPVSVAAWLRRVPAVVFLPDIEPGLALKVMAKLATRVATTTAASAQYIGRQKMVVTGYPLREVFYTTNRAQARAQFGLQAADKVLLVFGGSKGARSINRAVTQNINALLDIAGLRVLHVTGKNDWAEVSAARNALPPEWQARYQIFEYLHEEMAAVMAAADLVVCRSGASSLGELPFVGLPALLVPYPYAWRYQKVNAQYLAERGAAVVMEDAQLAGQLVNTVNMLMNDPARLSQMRQTLLDMSGREGAQAIAQLLLDVATQGAAARVMA